jgi:hypothetical protein
MNLCECANVNLEFEECLECVANTQSRGVGIEA